jgi:hypothetical protein
MSTPLWVLLAVAELTLSVRLALTTLCKGHYLLFWVGTISRVLWIIGAITRSNADNPSTRGIVAGGTTVLPAPALPDSRLPRLAGESRGAGM